MSLRCTNPQCSFTSNETFNFVDKRRRNTNATDMLIIQTFHDLSTSTSSIATKYNVSDTYVLDTFDRYIKMNKLPLIFYDRPNTSRTIRLKTFRTWLQKLWTFPNSLPVQNQRQSCHKWFLRLYPFYLLWYRRLNISLQYNTGGSYRSTCIIFPTYSFVFVLPTTKLWRSRRFHISTLKFFYIFHFQSS